MNFSISIDDSESGDRSIISYIDNKLVQNLIEACLVNRFFGDRSSIDLRC